jgi:vacuolar-type H+-ATPase subunit C/Vma6
MPAALRIPKPRGHADSGEQAYAYAKACGIIGKSMVGKRISALAKLNSLSELDRLIFPDTYHELPVREMLVDLERRILRRTVEHILVILASYSSPPELLVRQLRSCEYADLKTCLHHIAAGKKKPPPLSDIGAFRTVRFEAYPDLAAMIAGTEFTFISADDIAAIQSPNFDITPLEVKLDLHYYTMLIKSLRRLPASGRPVVERILAEEISLRNCAWALRLRTYFNKKPNEVESYLMDLTINKSSEASLAQEALRSLNFPLDSPAEWKKWRWKALMNPQTENWAADPRHFQNAASRYIYNQCIKSFRNLPFSVSSIFCYIKLKQFEEDLLTSITEGLGLGMTGGDVFDLLEAR